MKNLVLTILLLTPVATALACYCGPPPLTPALLQKMEYVALVRIKSIVPPATPALASAPGYELEIEELMLVKGKPVKRVYNRSNRPDAPRKTDCDLDLRGGLDYLVMSNTLVNGLPKVSMCDHGRLYAYSPDYPAREPGVSPDAQAKLKFALKHLVIQQTAATTAKVPLRKGKKNGRAIYYYPNGSVMGRVSFRADSLNGKSTWYTQDGKVLMGEEYKMGMVKESGIKSQEPRHL